MLGLILKDLYNLKSYGKTICLSLAFFILIGTMSDDSAIFISGMCSMLFIMLSVYSFSYDSISKWDHYAQSLPISKQEIVLSKYLLAIILCVIGSAISLCIAIIVLKIKPIDGYGLTPQLITTGLLLCIVVCLLSILIPFIFKFGIEKARIIFISIFAAFAASIGVLQSTGIPKPSEDTLILLGKLFPFVTIAIFILSYFLSSHIYQNKEI